MTGLFAPWFPALAARSLRVGLWRAIAWLALWLWGAGVLAQPAPLQLQAGQAATNLWQALQMLPDPEQRYTAQDLLQVDGVHIWVVLLDRTESTAAVLPQLRALLPAGLQAVPWSDLADFYNKTSELFQRQMFVLRLMIAVIILLSISNSLMMNVMERTGEIGTLCALGTRRRSILKIFSLEALALGLLGAATGTALGVTIASVASAVGIPMPPAPGMDKGFVAEILVTPALAGSTFGLAVIATFVSGLYPAWKASRLVIVDALRHNR